MMNDSDSENKPGSPLMPDVGILAAVPDDWGDSWMPRHHILVRLAKYFNVVWYGRMRDRRNVTRSNNRGGSYEVENGLTVYRQDWWLPVLYKPKFAADFTNRVRLRRASNLLLSKGIDRAILYIWRPEFDRLLDEVRHDVSVYHVDDEYTFSEEELPVPEREHRLISRADLVIAHSPELMKKKGNINPNSIFIPNGVDYKAYSTCTEEAADIAAIPHPRIGYVGYIKSELDFELLVSLADRHPEWSFIFVGPTKRDLIGHSALEALSARENVYFLGGKPVKSLPEYNCFFDVSILCYRENDYTKFIFPMKLNEYLATGKPVVGSPIQSLLEFEDDIRLARSIDDWSEALTESLAPASNTEREIARRKAVAKAHDWDGLARKIALEMCRQLGPSYVDRFESLIVLDD